MKTLLLRPTRFLAYYTEFSKTPYLIKPKTPVYITCQVLFIVLLTFVVAIFNPGYFTAG